MTKENKRAKNSSLNEFVPLYYTRKSECCLWERGDRQSYTLISLVFTTCNRP